MIAFQRGQVALLLRRGKGGESSQDLGPRYLGFIKGTVDNFLRQYGHRILIPKEAMRILTCILLERRLYFVCAVQKKVTRSV